MSRYRNNFKNDYCTLFQGKMAVICLQRLAISLQFSVTLDHSLHNLANSATFRRFGKTVIITETAVVSTALNFPKAMFIPTSLGKENYFYTFSPFRDIGSQCGNRMVEAPKLQFFSIQITNTSFINYLRYPKRWKRKGA